MAVVADMAVRIVNWQAVIAFGKGLELLREASADAPWNDDLKEAIGLFEMAARGMEVNDK